MQASAAPPVLDVGLGEGVGVGVGLGVLVGVAVGAGLGVGVGVLVTPTGVTRYITTPCAGTLALIVPLVRVVTSDHRLFSL